MYIPPWENGMINPGVFAIIGILILIAFAAAVVVMRKKEDEIEQQATMLLIGISSQVVGLGAFLYYAFDPATASRMLPMPVMIFGVLFFLLAAKGKTLSTISKVAIKALIALFSIGLFIYTTNTGEVRLIEKFFGAEQTSFLFYIFALLWLGGLASTLWSAYKDIFSLSEQYK
jgi:hypothetical protein